jgi:hypothetical protein
MLAAALAVAAAVPVQAQRAGGAPASVEVDVGGRPIKLTAAEGQCVLDRAQQADRAILDLVTRALAGQNELLFHTADCANLTQVRLGRTPYLNNFAQVQVLLQLRDREFRGQEKQVVKEVCTYMRTQADALQKKVGPEIERRIQSLAAGIAVNEQKPLGVLDEDDQACYAETLLGLSTPTGEKRVLLGVYAVTVLNGRIIYLYRYQTQPDDSTQKLLLGQIKKAVKYHVALNSGAAVPPAKK